MKSSSECKPVLSYNSCPLLSFKLFHLLFLVSATVSAETNTSTTHSGAVAGVCANTGLDINSPFTNSTREYRFFYCTHQPSFKDTKLKYQYHITCQNGEKWKVNQYVQTKARRGTWRTLLSFEPLNRSLASCSKAHSADAAGDKALHTWTQPGLSAALVFLGTWWPRSCMTQN